GRASDIFHSAAVRSSRSFFSVFLQNHCLAVFHPVVHLLRRRQPFSILQPVENLAQIRSFPVIPAQARRRQLFLPGKSHHTIFTGSANPYGITPRIHFATSLLWH